jgi:hypothetical protein
MLSQMNFKQFRAAVEKIVVTEIWKVTLHQSILIDNNHYDKITVAADERKFSCRFGIELYDREILISMQIHHSIC